MGGGGPDLYAIGLDPSGADTGVPGPSSPSGSIGGSGVGANAADDQRVRDLIEQMEQSPSLTQYINSLISIAPESDILTMYFAGVAGRASIGSPLSGSPSQCGQRFPGVPMVAHFSATCVADWGDSVPGTWTAAAYLYVDDVLWAAVPASGTYTSVDSLGVYTGGSGFTLAADWILNAGVDLPARFGFGNPMSVVGLTGPPLPGFTAAQQQQAFAAGNHTLRIDWYVNGTAIVNLSVSNIFLQFRRASNLGCFFAGPTGE